MPAYERAAGHRTRDELRELHWSRRASKSRYNGRHASEPRDLDEPAPRRADHEAAGEPFDVVKGEHALIVLPPANRGALRLQASARRGRRRWGNCN